MILGAGVCGLYAALTALRNGASVTIIEKSSQPGGLASGHQRGKNFFDMGVHMLHAFDKEIAEDICSIMGDEKIDVPLDARIRWNGSNYRYPLKGIDMIKGMNTFHLARCLSGLVIAEIRRKLSPTSDASIATAEDALIEFYGAPLYEFFFEQFTHKYWGIHPKQLSAEFIRRKMPRLSAFDFIRKLIRPLIKNCKEEDLVERATDEETLHYSRTGAESMPRLLAAEVSKLGAHIIYGADIHSVTGTLCDYSLNGQNASVTATHIISTIPITSLVQYETSAPEGVVEASQKLSFKPIATYGLLVKKSTCTTGLYTYFRDRIFHRVGEPKNAGLIVQPEDHSVLIVEMTCSINDAKWNDAETIREQIQNDLSEEGICEPQEIIEWHHFKNAYGYPIYDLGFETHLETINKWLNSQPTISSIGRQGGFTYPGMHSAMRMGHDTVKKIITQHAPINS